MSTLNVPIQINGKLGSQDNTNKPSDNSLLERELYIAKDGKLYYGKPDGGKIKATEIVPTWSIHSNQIGNAKEIGSSDKNNPLNEGINQLILTNKPETDTLYFGNYHYSNIVGRAGYTAMWISPFNLYDNGYYGTNYLCIDNFLANKVRRLSLSSGYSYGTLAPDNKNNKFFTEECAKNLVEGQLYFKIVG